jgi:uncharacterized protein
MACPICQKPADTKYRPFCSRRCADLDLGRWLNEGYRIESPASEEESAPPDSTHAPGRPN